MWFNFICYYCCIYTHILLIWLSPIVYEYEFGRSDQPDFLEEFIDQCTNDEKVSGEIFIHILLMHCEYVTRFTKPDPNRTSGKIKLSLPVGSYTIVLVILTLTTTQTTQYWFQQTSFLGGV